jgi:uncharacterized protein
MTDRIEHTPSHPTVRVVPILKGSRHFSAMFKPVGPRCNLACSYCYYQGKEHLLGVEQTVIDKGILAKFIHDYIDGNDGSEVYFEWQGGEPTLLGMDFFRTVLRLQQQFRPPHKQIFNSIQTNGTLLDDAWCGFLAENGFLVGLSLDGPKELHDAYRVTKGGEPTFERVVAAARLLKQHGVEFTTLTVINRLNARHPLEVYRFLTREIGPRMLQFIPCVEPKDFETVAPWRWAENSVRSGSSAARPGTADSLVTDWSVDPDDFGSFLCAIFDEWHKHDIGRHYVNLFESFVASWAGLPPQVCVFNDFCGKSVMVELDGSVYSCDHFAYPEYRLGNISTTSLVDQVFSQQQVGFGFDKKDHLPEQCRKCCYLGACYGECPRNRFVRTSDGEAGLNYLCPGLKKFFSHAERRLQALARGVRR